MAPESSFSWARGEDSVSSYSKDGRYKVSFCSHCGSPVPNKFGNFPLYSVPVGSIDNPQDINVVVKIHLDFRAQWDKDNFDGERFPEMPTLNEMLEFLHVPAKP